MRPLCWVGFRFREQPQHYNNMVRVIGSPYLKDELAAEVAAFADAMRLGGLRQRE